MSWNPLAWLLGFDEECSSSHYLTSDWWDLCLLGKASLPLHLSDLENLFRGDWKLGNSHRLLLDMDTSWRDSTIIYLGISRSHQSIWPGIVHHPLGLSLRVRYWCSARSEFDAKIRSCAWRITPQLWWAFAFTAPLGLVNPMSRAHVKLLGLCFKTGQRELQSVPKRNSIRNRSNTCPVQSQECEVPS